MLPLGLTWIDISIAAVAWGFIIFIYTRPKCPRCKRRLVFEKKCMVCASRDLDVQFKEQIREQLKGMNLFHKLFSVRRQRISRAKVHIEYEEEKPKEDSDA